MISAGINKKQSSKKSCKIIANFYSWSSKTSYRVLFLCWFQQNGVNLGLGHKNLYLKLQF